jgi:hypothetical protein
MEHGYVKQKLKGRFLRLNFPFINVGHIGYDFEGIKRNTDRKA